MSDFPIVSVTEGSEQDLEIKLSTYKKSLISYKDASGNTVLHISLQNEKMGFIKILLENEKNYSTPHEITNWVNEVNQDGYSVLHLSVSKGILTLVRLLIQYGASTDIKTPMGLDVVHLAAQGDFPQLIAYFVEIGLNLESTDSRGLTPLHWASYMGAYHSALVLCSCRVSRNTKDLEGHTPLHLAVVGNNLRCVKLLVIKGAIKDNKDLQGKTPMDHAVINRHKNIIDSLKNNTFLEIMGFKPNITPFATSLWPFVILMGILISSFIIVGIFCATYNREGSYLFAITSTIVVCLMIYIVNSDPGFLQKKPNTKLTELYYNHKPGEICPDCGIVKAPRSRHCHQCHRCVKKFDHHCQWMNNCIGAKNLGIFYGFILTLWLNIIIGIWLCCSVLASAKDDNDGDDIPLITSKVVGGISIFIELFMFFPVSYLLWTHTKNFISGLTTNERMSAGSKASKNSNGCLGNCGDMCCNSSKDEENEVAGRFDSTTSENFLEVSLQETK